MPMSSRTDRRRGRARPSDDSGSAVVEFLAGTVLLLIPVVYLTVTLGQLQAATFAVHTAAREAARAAVTTDDPAQGAERARAAVHLAMADQGVTGDALVTVTCSADPCRPDPTQMGDVAATVLSAEVSVTVALPGVPAFLADRVPLSVPVSATVVTQAEPFRAGP